MYTVSCSTYSIHFNSRPRIEVDSKFKTIYLKYGYFCIILTNKNNISKTIFPFINTFILNIYRYCGANPLYILCVHQIRTKELMDH